MGTVIPERATLKLARGKASTDVDYVATVSIKVPGEIGSDEGRVVAGGQGWFETPHIDDYFKIHIVDEDGLQAPPGTIIGSFTDLEVDLVCQGVYVPKGKQYLEITAFGDFGFVPAGMYLRVVGIKGDSTHDTLRCNFQWGKRET